MVAKDAKTTEQRLRIEVVAIKESYNNGEINIITSIPGPINTAGRFTKMDAKTNLCDASWRQLKCVFIYLDGPECEKGPSENKKSPVSIEIDDDEQIFDRH